MAVLVNGKPQKELNNGVVKLPFGEIYSLRFRNKNNRRAVVKFYIDGENVSGNGYIIPANDYVDIERHHDKDRQFKFVSLESEEAVDFGKNGPNHDKSKGVIEARFYLEKEKPIKIVEEHHHHHHYRPRTPIVPPYVPPYQPYWFDGTGQNSPYIKGGGGSGITCSSNASLFSGPSINTPLDFSNLQDSVPSANLQEGCTVEGGISGQSFHSVHIDVEEDFVALKIVLMGYEGVVEEVVITRSEVSFCENCGAKKAKNSAKFCYNCGHKL